MADRFFILPKRHHRTKLRAVLLVLLSSLVLGACSNPQPPDAVPPANVDAWPAYRAGLQTWAQPELDRLQTLPIYSLQARLSADGSQLEGDVRALVTNTGRLPLDDLVFRLYPNTPHYGGRMDVSQLTVMGAPASGQVGADGTALRVVLPQALPPGQQVQVGMHYQVGLPQGSADYTLFGWSDSILSLPGFAPVLAIHEEGNQDDPGRWLVEVPPLFADVQFSALAFYDLELTVPERLTVVTSGRTIGRTDAGGGYRTWHVLAGPVRDMAVLASDRWQVVSQSAAGATVNSYYPAGADSAGQAALFHAAAALRLYSDNYGPYPYTELDVVSVPLGYRGMEYSGLITIGEQLYGPLRDQLGFLIAHETAHQWWYVQVANDPLAYPWLDEGLAEYCVYDYYRSLYGQTVADELLEKRWQFPVEAGAAGGITGAAARPASAMDAASYELLAYAKAALFFDAVHRQVGDDTYKRALRLYVDRYRWHVVSPERLLDTLQQTSSKDLSPLVRQWLQ